MMIELSAEPIVEEFSFPFPIPKTLPDSAPNNLLLLLILVSLPIVAVQWHPERYYTKESEIIFDYFLEKVNEYRENNN